MFQQCLEGYRSLHGEDSTDVAGTYYNNTTGVYDNQARQVRGGDGILREEFED